MGSVLITGMTAPQCSANLVAKSKSFGGVLRDSLVARQINVDMLSPSISMGKEFIDSYDKIIVGVSPVLSLSSNYSYGALSVIFNTLTHDSSKLVLFVDSPDPAAIRNSLKTVDKSFMTLFKPFYSARKEHSSANNDHKTLARIEKAVEFLLYEWNVTTLYPSLPFVDVSVVEDALFGCKRGVLTGLNADSIYIEKTSAIEHANRSRTWCVDNDKTKWFSKVAHSIRQDYVPMKSHKMSTDDAVESVMSQCSGAIICPPVGDTPWWSYRYAQAMNIGLPIMTEWRYSSSLGESWGLIPSSIEELSDNELLEINASQVETYIAAVGSSQAALDSVLRGIGLNDNDKASI